MTDIEELKEKLASEDYEERIAACKELEEFSDDAIDLLINTFNDENPHVRFQAAKSLSQIGTPAIKPLIEAL